MLKISLRVKFLLVMTSLLFVAVLSYLILAVSLFNADKSTYIFEGNATLVNTIAAETRANFKSIQKSISLIKADLENGDGLDKKVIEKIFNDEDEFVDLRVYSESSYPLQPSFSMKRQDFYDPYGINPKDLANSQIKRLPDVRSQNIEKLNFYNASVGKQIPLLGMITKVGSTRTAGSWIIQANLRQDRRIKLFSRSETFTTYLTDLYGNILAHPDSEKIVRRSSIAGSALLNQIIASKFDTGVKAAKVDKRDIIYGFSKIEGYDLIVISEIERSKAFLASQRLIEKSVLFAILILSCCLIVSVLFSKRITASLEKLYQATEEIMKGNFHVKVNVQSSDEVGALSSSFNRMTGEISRLMVETADKARIEKELETAQLVQDNFFPVNNLKIGQYDLSSFYQPASECGGDWWGHIILEDKVIVLIGDATGHGVPSALITAAAQSCCSTLEAIQKEFPSLHLTPGLVLSKLNNAIFRASRGTVKMTFFCGVLDLNSAKFSYANASHEMPLLCHADQTDLKALRTKKDIAVCSGKTGFILGQDTDCSYDEHEVDFLPGEVLVFYTDGLVECKNKEEQMYGKGRLLRNIFKNAHMTSEAIRDQLIKDAMTHFGEKERDDDVTLVVVKHVESAVLKRAV